MAIFQSGEAAFGPARIGGSALTRTIRWAVPWAFILAFAAMLTTGDLTSAQTPQAHEPIQFNIPSQPLDAALNRYGDATGREALYDTSLAAGRVSSEVQGALTPDEALERLLAGTGLSAQFVAENSFVLLPTPPANRQTTQQAASPAHRRYYGLIQGSLLDALCRSNGTRPGRYRFVAVFWIGLTGMVEKSQRIGSTGIADIDQKIDTALRNVRFSEPPPAGFEQPVLILIVPQAPGMTLGCDRADARLRQIEAAP